MTVPGRTRAALAFAAAALLLLTAQTALWALLFRPWSDALGFGLLFALATLPLSGVASLFGALWIARRTCRSAGGPPPTSREPGAGTRCAPVHDRL